MRKAEFVYGRTRNISPSVNKLIHTSTRRNSQTLLEEKKVCEAFNANND